jgi:hypothetical protein
MAWGASHCLRPPIPTLQSFIVPTLKRTNINPGQPACRLQPGAIAPCLGNTRYDYLAIFH